MSSLAIATLAAALIVLASILSVEVGISVALIEIMLGVVGGNVFGLTTTPWMDFLASFASIVLTFLAGAEVDVSQLRREWKPSVSIGVVSFFAPFAVVGLLAYYGLGAALGMARGAGAKRIGFLLSPPYFPLLAASESTARV